MIRLVKPVEPPKVLLTRGAVDRAKMCRLFTRFAAKYADGTKRFKPLSNIYAHKTVKAALSVAQHGKCFLCEAKFEHVAYGDIEHFRPKGGYMQDELDTLHTPGYYWLAYDWDNLFLSCQICNQQFKKNYFPLRAPSARAASHKADVGVEQPLLVNPATDDPQQFISFRAEMPFAVRGNGRGKATIKRSGLDREPLRMRRFDHYMRLKRTHTIARLSVSRHPDLKAIILDAQQELADAVKETAEYASMIRAALKARFQVV